MVTSHSQSNGVTKEVMTAAWAIALAPSPNVRFNNDKYSY